MGALYKEQHHRNLTTRSNIMGALYKEQHHGSIVQGATSWEPYTRNNIWEPDTRSNEWEK
jgi:hypothetical protein